MRPRVFERPACGFEWVAKPGWQGGGLRPERVFVIPCGVKAMRLESNTAGPSVTALDVRARA